MTLILVVGCTDSQNGRFSVRPDGFKVDILLPTTPIKHQGHTEFCWIYTAVAAIETDRLAQGDSITISTLWLERKMFEKSAEECFFTGKDISSRGTLMMAMSLIHDYGIVTYDSYRSREITHNSKLITHNSIDSISDSRILCRQLTQLAKTFASQHRSLDDMRCAAKDIIDSAIGHAPHLTFLYGAQYTPEQYARSCNIDSWQAFTSFAHHPFGQTFAPELKDNQWHQQAMNIPVDSLLSMTVRSINHRHPVMWEGCMKQDLPADRQSAFERHQLTDDHCMCIIGIGHDAKGTKYFILKNSWGYEDGDYGLRYMTFDQFKRSTILILAHQE